VKRNRVYRVRILNGKLNGVYKDIAFKTGCKEYTGIVSGKSVAQVNCSQTLQFTVIGADSTIFKRPVPGIKSVNISSAERLELLLAVDLTINGSTENKISKSENLLYLAISDQIYGRYKLVETTG
jgi:hypothetical protein